jgi:lipooligosaccharide transport system permease protein
VTGVIFAGLAMIVSYRAKGWETFVFYVSLVITPMAFLSGVYFPREQLPETIYQLSNWLPLTWSVGWLRALVL